MRGIVLDLRENTRARPTMRGMEQARGSRQWLTGYASTSGNLFQSADWMTKARSNGDVEDEFIIPTARRYA